MSFVDTRLKLSLQFTVSRPQVKILSPVRYHYSKISHPLPEITYSIYHTILLKTVVCIFLCSLLSTYFLHLCRYICTCFYENWLGRSDRYSP